MKLSAFKLVLLLAAFTLIQGGLFAAEPVPKIYPAYYNGKTWPALNQMTRISIDPANDHKTDHLDLVADYFCFSDTRFYAAIQNRGGGFPSSGSLGTEYFSYMAVIANNADLKHIWAMVHINVPMTSLKPGLYRIEVKKQTLTRIGDISYEIAKGSNLLKMSCNISTLLADPLFKAWYKTEQPSFSLGSQSLRTRLIPFGTKLQDSTNTGVEIILLRK